jgi:hypothetical protein
MLRRKAGLLFHHGRSERNHASPNALNLPVSESYFDFTMRRMFDRNGNRSGVLSEGGRDRKAAMPKRDGDRHRGWKPPASLPISADPLLSDAKQL